MTCRSSSVFPLVVATVILLLSACTEKSTVDPSEIGEKSAPEAPEIIIGSSPQIEDENPFAFSSRNHPEAVVERAKKSDANQITGSDGVQERLEQLIATGHNGDDSHNSWRCITENVMGESTDLSLRFWLDLTGDIANQRMSWSLTDSDSLKIVVEQKGIVKLSDIEFESRSHEYDYFTAVDNKGELSSCQWEGMSRSIDLE